MFWQQTGKYWIKGKTMSDDVKFSQVVEDYKPTMKPQDFGGDMAKFDLYLMTYHKVSEQFEKYYKESLEFTDMSCYLKDVSIEYGRSPYMSSLMRIKFDGMRALTGWFTDSPIEEAVPYLTQLALTRWEDALKAILMEEKREKQILESIKSVVEADTSSRLLEVEDYLRKYEYAKERAYILMKDHKKIKVTPVYEFHVWADDDGLHKVSAEYNGVKCIKTSKNYTPATMTKLAMECYEQAVLLSVIGCKEGAIVEL
jgi:hypothetical protein